MPGVAAIVQPLAAEGRRASGRCRVGQCGQVGIVPVLVVLQPLDSAVVPLLAQVEVHPRVAEVDKVPGGDVLDEEQQDGVALIAGGREYLTGVVLCEITAGLLNGRVDGGQHGGIVAPADGLYIFLVDMGVHIFDFQVCHIN